MPNTPSSLPHCASKRVWQYKNRIRCIAGNYCSPLFMAVKRAHRRVRRRSHHRGTHYRTICSSDHASPDIRPSLAGKIWRPTSHSSFSNKKQPTTCHHHLPRIRKRRTSGWGTDSQTTRNCLYDKELITLVAKESNFSEDFISKTNKNFPVHYCIK